MHAIARSLVALVVMTAAASAGEQAPAAGPTPLFNGTDLSGWVWGAGGPVGTTLADVCTVTDGVLRCAPVKGWGYLRTERSFADGVLTLRMRHGMAGNGGLLVRALPPDRVWPRSLEILGQSGRLGTVIDIDGLAGAMRGDPRPQRFGSAQIRILGRSGKPAEKPVGEWNDLRIELQGPRFRLWVNDVLQNEVDTLAPGPGWICLMCKDAPIEYRDIAIAPTTAATGDAAR